jgi:hypothetical protein
MFATRVRPTIQRFDAHTPQQRAHMLAPDVTALTPEQDLARIYIELLRQLLSMGTRCQFRLDARSLLRKRFAFRLGKKRQHEDTEQEHKAGSDTACPKRLDIATQATCHLTNRKGRRRCEKPAEVVTEACARTAQAGRK